MNLIPAQIGCLFKPFKNKAVCIGPLLTAEINYQFYPDLHSGYTFWFTHYGLCALFSYPFRVTEHQFKHSLSSSVLGFTSRPKPERNSSFYDLGITYALDIVHSNLQFGSLNRYNQSGIEIRWQRKPSSVLAIAYALDYYAYYKVPRIFMLNQSLKFIMLPKIKIR
ncbi:MAG: hypothetical protein Q8M15_16265 [Bacteroidota bacterium]|nr:hypothetical protein [Bacteroidota bacterium]